ncbi:MAG TPA: hypothetical protein VH008_34415 [Pseudonocardia sp.]|nr:hypothetical protein [Pseudonocardia sp.]
MGDPLLADTELGPVAFAGQLAKIEDYVRIGREDGGRVVHGPATRSCSAPDPPGAAGTARAVRRSRLPGRSGAGRAG